MIFIREQQPGRTAYIRFPGGRVDPGEDWLTAARRECAEEIGLTFNQWRLVNVRQPVAKVEWFVVTYIAFDPAGEVPVQHDAGERIVSMPMTFDEAKAYITDTSDPLNDYTCALFEGLNSLEDLRNMPEFRGKKVTVHI